MLSLTTSGSQSREERSSRSAQPRVGNFSDKPIDLHTRKEGRQIDDFLNEIKNKQASKPFEGDLPTGNTSNIIGPDNQTMEQRGSFDVSRLFAWVDEHLRQMCHLKSILCGCHHPFPRTVTPTLPIFISGI